MWITHTLGSFGMGKYRFRLSHMIPNAWFYKLKDMTRAKNLHKTTNPRKNKYALSLPSSTTTSVLSSSAAASNHLYKITKVQTSNLSDQRKSFYFTRDLVTSHLNSPGKTRSSDKQYPAEPPRKSSRRRRTTNTKINRLSSRLVSSPVPAGSSCPATSESTWTKPLHCTTEEYQNSPPVQDSSPENDSILLESGSDHGLNPETSDGMLSFSTSCKCRMENDIPPIDVYNNKITSNNEFDRLSKLDHLPPIITKKQEPNTSGRISAEAGGYLPVKVVNDQEYFLSTTTWSSKVQHKTTTSSVVRRSFSASSSSQGVKLRLNSPRIANLRIQGRKSSSSGSRGSLSESFAVVKSSKDPRRDFMESMVEMIIENNIKASKDLEELLACYLSLNSDEYHDLIINVFKQIWFDFIHVCFN